MPLPVLTGKAQMPANSQRRLDNYNALLIPADKLAEEAGNIKSSNVVLLGALAAKLDISPECWQEQIKARVPQKTIEINLTAFQAGFNFRMSS